MSNSIQELFNVSDQLAKNLEIPHKLAVPKISKIVINAGIGTIKEDNKAIEKMKKDLSLISGQSPVIRMSKKAIASFKIRGYNKKSFDGQGNITIGIKDHIIFPEISVENVENIFGFDITIATSANNDKEGYELLKLMNFPFLN